MSRISPAPNTLLVKLGQLIRTFRKARGLSQEGLAGARGLHQTYVGRLERVERNINIAHMSGIAEALGVSLSELLQKVDRKRIK
jgi:transcriptional regulator with XRE-family HTH domain